MAHPQPIEIIRAARANGVIILCRSAQDRVATGGMLADTRAGAAAWTAGEGK